MAIAIHPSVDNGIKATADGCHCHSHREGIRRVAACPAAMAEYGAPLLCA
jgi:hypothetical protein